MDKEQYNSPLPRNINNRFGSISKMGQYNIEVNIMSWNNGYKKLDIRLWSGDGRSPKKGLTFNREEYIQLINILTSVDPMLIDCGKTFSEMPQEKCTELSEAAAVKLQEYSESIHEAAAAANEAFVELTEKDESDEPEQLSATVS